MKKIFIYKLGFISFLCLIFIGCDFKKEDKTKKEDISKVESKEKEIVDVCIRSKPVKKSSLIYKSSNISESFFSDIEFKKLINNIDKIKVKIDSSVIYTTHSDFQREIHFSKNCHNKISSLGEKLMKEFFVSDIVYDDIKFIRTYNKKVLNFGNAFIYEFEILGGSEFNPHNIILILKEKDNVYKGISFCSDGIRWGELSNNEWIPLFVERVRIHKQYEIAMNYDGNKFIPIGHHKIPELWKED